MQGNPFFPIILYGPGTADEMQEAADAGFNCTTYGPKETAQRHGLLCLADENGGYNKETWIANYLIDEPEGTSPDGSLKYTPFWVEEHVRLSKVHHATLPTMVMFHDLSCHWLAEGYLESNLDVIGLDPYPHIHGKPLSAITEAMGYVRWHDRRRLWPRPIWVILQAWWDVGWPDVPSAWDTKAMAMMALVHGAKGIGWFSYRFPMQGRQVLCKDTYPELWAAVLETAGQVAQVHDALADSWPRPCQYVDTVAYIECSNEEHYYLLAVEEAGRKANVGLTLHPRSGFHLEDGTVLGCSRPISTISWEGYLQIHDAFEPFESRMYVFPMSSEC